MGLLGPSYLILLLKMPRVHKTAYARNFLTAPYVTIFRRENGLLGPFEGPVPKNREIFGP